MIQDLPPAEAAKRAAAARSLMFVEDGMKLGLGTGSTAKWMVDLLGERLAEEDLHLVCVPTSSRTRDQAASLGIPLTTLDEAGWLDLVIDGADEFDAGLRLIKGGGGALLQEKIVAAAADRMIVISDPSKEVATLGAFPLPVEVVRFGAGTTARLIERALASHDVGNRRLEQRQDAAGPYVTDEGHYIFDLHLQRIGAPEELNLALNAIPGVVETGLFTGLASAVIVGQPDGTARVMGQG